MESPRLIAAMCTLAALINACSSNDKKVTHAEAPDGATAADGGQAVGKITAPATFVAGGSIGQVWVTDATEGDELILANADSIQVGSGKADRLGSLILRNIAPGDGYTVRHVAGSTVTGTKAFKVLARTDVPDPSLYTQVLAAGLNYVKMRDGIELAMTVRLPEGKTLADGPFPTIIEYSGYQVAAPGDLLAAAAKAVTSGMGVTGLGADPLLPDTATAVGSLIAPLVGFAAVSVQMRGSGCSGGDFQLFDVPTTYDGYDAIETVATQSWVKGGKVGMAGISFSGISQLAVAGTRPPSLAAISPMSVIDDLYDAPGFPGGIFNNGFAASWLKERQANAEPATATASGAQPYATALIKGGDTQCLDNQKLRLQTINIDTVINSNPFRDPALIDDRSPITWADKINVPVFLVGQFQDEQTGGHFPEMLSKMDGNPDVWISMQNGAHADSLGPRTIARWLEFLDLFVANQIPNIPDSVRSLSGQLYNAIAAGSPSEPIPPTRFDAFTDVDAARTKFKEDARVRFLLDSGSGQLGPGAQHPTATVPCTTGPGAPPCDEGPGALQPAWELTFDSWPVKTATATSFYLDTNGVLSSTAPAATAEISYTGDSSKRPRTTLGGTGPDGGAAGTSDPWAALPNYHWEPVAAGLGFTSAALTADVVVAGTSSLDLQLKSSAKDTDLQVTLSDVRPDGQEMYVNAGWLRASHRAIDASRSTATDPVQTHLRADAKDMPAGAFDTARVQIYAVGYAFRKGEKIRVTIQAPGGERPSWAFDTIEDGSITDTVQLGPSKLVLPVVPGATAGAPLPACPSNRGQPCRTYTPASNGG